MDIVVTDNDRSELISLTFQCYALSFVDVCRSARLKSDFFYIFTP